MLAQALRVAPQVAIRAFAENQPLTHVINAMRAWMVGTPVGNSAVAAFAWCLGIIVVTVPAATWLFQRRTAR
jgi:ABC-2 type transport system permease protein